MSELIEKIFNWIASDNFVWFILGWSVADFLYSPGLWSFLFVCFWIWVLNREEM